MTGWIIKMLRFLPKKSLYTIVKSILRLYVEATETKFDDDAYNLVVSILDSVLLNGGNLDKEEIVKLIITLFDTLAKRTDTEADDNLTELMQKFLPTAIG